MKEAIKILEHLVAVLNKELDKTKRLIEQHIHGNPEVKQRIENICLIKGLALLSVATVVAETNGFELFENIPQLISFAGYDVVEDQSGKRVGKTKISKKGNSHIRRILHMPALNMITYDVGAMPSLFERTFDRHGIKMKSYVAIQKKLLILIYTLWKKNEKFDPDYHKKQSAGVKEPEASFRFVLEEDVQARA